MEGGPAPQNASALLRDRRAVFEVLFAEESLRKALRAGEPAARLEACAEAAGFRPLARQLEALVAAGSVSATEAASHLA